MPLVQRNNHSGNGNRAVPAGYDGDGKADPVVRSDLPSPAVAGYAKAGNGNEWIVMFSSGGYTPKQVRTRFEGQVIRSPE